MIRYIINKIKVLYYSIKLSRMIDRDISTDDYRRGSLFNKDFGSSIEHELEYSEIENERLYHEALLQIKQEVNKRIQNPTAENYDRILKNIEDLAELAKKSPNQTIDIMKSIYIKKGKDVATNTDEEKMIQQRINHFYQLQRHKEQKELVRRARAARKEGNIKLAEQLEKEWKDTYLN